MRSVLELALPAGRAARSLVIGEACPAGLRPQNGPGSDGGPVDLVVVAPSEAERGGAGWLEGAVTACAERLHPDGIAYLLVPPRARIRARSLCAERGLALGPHNLHLPDVGGTRHVVPLGRRATDTALSRIVPVAPWKRAALKGLLRVARGGPVATLDPRVVLVARRTQGRPLYHWLDVPGLGLGPGPSAVVSRSWRPLDPRALVHPVTAAGDAPLVIKIGLDGGPGPAAERGLLDRLGPAARAAGASVPVPLDVSLAIGLDTLVESRLDGDLLATELVRDRRLLEDGLRDVCRWLASWHRLTVRRSASARDVVEREIMAPASVVAPRLDGGERYLDRLRDLCGRVAAGGVPVVASHNDLTTWNLLRDERGRLGVVDWEAAEVESLPLKDFFYAVVDAVAVAADDADRVRAFRACFDGNGSYAGLVGDLQRSVSAAAGAPPEVVELAAHACWLGHAVNELESADPAAPTPFVDVLRLIAARPADGPGSLAE